MPPKQERCRAPIPLRGCLQLVRRDSPRGRVRKPASGGRVGAVSVRRCVNAAPSSGSPREAAIACRRLAGMACERRF